MQTAMGSVVTGAARHLGIRCASGHAIRAARGATACLQEPTATIMLALAMPI